MDGQDYFCHYSQIIMPGYKRLDAGDEVQFDVEIGPKEKPQATRVTLVRKAQVA
jgi:cold shock CspA family protein